MWRLLMLQTEPPKATPMVSVLLLLLSQNSKNESFIGKMKVHLALSSGSRTPGMLLHLLGLWYRGHAAVNERGYQH